MPLAQPLPDLGSLDLLVSVAHRGSINEAARAHSVSQPAASMRLRSLERVLGVQLLERSATGSRLTPAGLATVEWAGGVLENIEGLLAGVAALRNDARSQLRLAASLTVAEYLVPAWLQRFRVLSPDVVVSLQMGNTARVAELVGTAEVELGFLEGSRAPGRLRSRELLDDTLRLVVGPTHPWARRRRPLTAAQLAATPLLLREPGSGTREVLDDALAERGLTASTLVELASTTAIKSAAIAGTGPAVLSALAITAEVSAGHLVVVSCDELTLRRKIRAVWADRHPPGEAASRFLSVIIAHGRR